MLTPHHSVPAAPTAAGPASARVARVSMRDAERLFLDIIAQGYHSNYSATMAHSNNPLAKGMFGHSLMASAVSDWMAIWDSAVTFVGGESAYGMTAAIGTGKACSCASHNVESLPATISRCDTPDFVGFKSKEGQVQCPIGKSKVVLCARRGEYTRSLA